MQVQQIGQAVDLDTLREEWDALLEHSDANSVFLTWEWLRTWWKYLAEHRRLNVLALRDGGELIAVAPLGIRPPSLKRLFPFRSVDFLGSGTAGSDYLDLIVRRGWEAAAIDAISHTLGRDRMLELNRMRSGAQAKTLAHTLQQSGWSAQTAPAGVCPYIDLRGQTWTAYLSTLGSQQRATVKRKLNTLASHFDVSFECVKDPLERGPALRLLIELHQKRWSEHGRSDAFHTDEHIEFHEEFTNRALRRGWLRLGILRLNEKPVSAVYALRYGPTYYFYQSGFDPQYSKFSVGAAAMAYSIRSAIEEGASEYDFLHGDEPYKFHWAKETRALEQIRLFPPGRRGQWFQTVLNARNRLRDWFRPIHVDAGAASALKA